jgi:ribosomal protein S27E
MQAGCPHCGHVQPVSEEAFGSQEVMKVICPSCGKAFQVFVPRVGGFEAETTRHAVESITSEITDDGRTLRLPPGKAVSVKVLEGEDKGTVYPVLKPRLTLGRSNSDIIVNDPLSSRIHCAIEFTGDGVQLRDLGSTNGTLVDNHPIRVAEIADGSIFQIGRHVFQLRISSEGA